MLAAVYRGIDNVQIETVPVPEIGPEEALVRIRCCGVCGTDLKKIHLGLVEPPRIFGHEMAGVIAALGSRVQGWQIGERVAVMHHVPCRTCWFCLHGDFAQCPLYKQTGTTAGFEPSGGGFGEYIRVMPWVVRDGMVRIPAHADLEEATFIEPLNTVMKAVRSTPLQPGDTALVVGQGQIGLLFTQLLTLEGIRVAASDPMEQRRSTSARLGAETVCNPAADDIGAVIRGITDGRGADAAFVCVPSASAASAAFDAVRPGGRVVLFAHTRKNDPLTVDGGDICYLEKALTGSYSSDISLQDACAELIFSRRLDVRPLITHRFPLAEIGQALSLASHPTESSLKVMVTL
jgi:L-iditol 2-dehydrogenase